MTPKIINGSSSLDGRGILSYNNDFDATVIKRLYFIENIDTDFIRAWQGHKVEQRWFSVAKGSFQIKLIKIDNWDNPSKDLDIISIVISDKKFDLLHISKGYVTSIQSLEKGSKLLVMSDYLFGEINDEYRFNEDYFKI
ncbi:sugar epimerase [Flavobacterium sp.]|uniref:sugar epimerase n=1 Tax=Flavobacterium sp. TaxID=239 RepID=UPI0038FCC5D4